MANRGTSPDAPDDLEQLLSSSVRANEARVNGDEVAASYHDAAAKLAHQRISNKMRRYITKESEVQKEE